MLRLHDIQVSVQYTSMPPLWLLALVHHGCFGHDNQHSKFKGVTFTKDCAFGCKRSINVFLFTSIHRARAKLYSQIKERSCTSINGSFFLCVFLFFARGGPLPKIAYEKYIPLVFLGIYWNTREYQGIPRNIMEYQRMSGNTMEYLGILWNIFWNTKEYMQKNAITQ